MILKGVSGEHLGKLRGDATGCAMGAPVTTPQPTA